MQTFNQAAATPDAMVKVISRPLKSFSINMSCYFAELDNVRLNKSDVSPVSHAPQGHPESGKLSERHINKILTSEGLAFKNATHDRSICSANIEGHEVLLLRQVDDFALATPKHLHFNGPACNHVLTSIYMCMCHSH